jgi:lysozyme family protein
MKHPFDVLKGEYSQLLAAMVVREECRHLVDEVAVKLIGFKTRYQAVSAQDGVPVVLIAPSFQREASSDFNLSPAQGDPWRRMSVHVPAHRGPYPSWLAAALDAYRINGLDKVGAGNWTWELICFYGEMFNGFGYRDIHRMHSPYLWGGTNIQTIGKYDADDEFNASHMDPQLGIIPVGKRMVELDPSLALPAVPYVPAPPIASGIAAEPEGDTKWIQQTLNAFGHQPPLVVDGNYGRQTARAVEQFQLSYGLEADGLAGPKTIAGLRAALAELAAELKP